MAVALARHDELVEQVVTSRGGRLIKTRGEGDATFSVFDRPSAAAAAAIELQDAIAHEPWTLREPMRIRVALHTGEVELRDGDYFGRAVNRAARLRSLAAGGQILCSGATAELVIDSLPDDVVLADLGMRQLRNLARPEHVFELRMQTTDDEPSAPQDRCAHRSARSACGLDRVRAVRRPRPASSHGFSSAWQTVARRRDARGAHRRRAGRRQDPPRRRVVPAGVRARRRRALRPLRRGPRRAVSAVRGSAPLGCAVPRRQPAARAAGRRGASCLWCPGSPTSCPTSPRRPAPTPTPNATHSSTRSLRCWMSRRRARQSFSYSTTCIGRPNPRCCCCAICCASASRRACRSSARIAAPTSTAPIPLRRCSPTCTATARPSACNSAASTRTT